MSRSKVLRKQDLDESLETASVITGLDLKAERVRKADGFYYKLSADKGNIQIITVPTSIELFRVLQGMMIMRGTVL